MAGAGSDVAIAGRDAAGEVSALEARGESQVLFSFGVVADVQYGDKDNEAAQSDPSRIKRYSESRQKLAAAVDHFNSVQSSLRCVLSLGDIIDGNETEELSSQDFAAIRKELQALEVQDVFHTIGNHCLSLPREHILRGLGMAQPYYDVALHAIWRLLVLDSMDLSTKWLEGTPQHQEAIQYLEEHPIESETEPQMKPWNGGLGKQQLEWLVKKLEEADSKGERVILALHHPVAPGSAPDNLLLWTYKEFLGVVSEHSSVKLVICGHYHPGGYIRRNGVHFVTFEGMVEAPTGSEAHAVVRVFPDRVDIEGHGFVTSRVLLLSDPEV